MIRSFQEIQKLRIKSGECVKFFIEESRDDLANIIIQMNSVLSEYQDIITEAKIKELTTTK